MHWFWRAQHYQCATSQFCATRWRHYRTPIAMLMHADSTISDAYAYFHVTVRTSITHLCYQLWHFAWRIRFTPSRRLLLRRATLLQLTMMTMILAAFFNAQLHLILPDADSLRVAQDYGGPLLPRHETILRNYLLAKSNTRLPALQGPRDIIADSFLRW